MAWDDLPPDQVAASSGWDSQPPDSEAPAPSLAGRIFSGLKRVAALPLTFPREQFNSAKDVLTAGQAADKVFPAENLLPAAAGTAGAIIGAGAPVPFASTLLAGAFSGAGEKLREGVRFLRGKPQDDGSVLKEGILGAASELGGAAALKVAGSVANKVIAKTGLTKFADKVAELVTPTRLKEADAVFEAVKSKPVAGASDTLEYVENFLEKRGITYKPSAEAIRQKMASEAMTPGQTIAANQDLINASAPKLVSDIKTPLLKEYEPMANILDDLAKPDLNYGQLKQIQQRVGDLANFGAGKRTSAERVFGKIYNKVSKDLLRTAEEGGFTAEHELVADQSRKVIQSRAMQNILNDSKISNASGTQIDFGRMARNLDMTDEEVQMLFGKDSDTVKALRDLSTEYAQRFSKSGARPYVSGSGSVGVTANPFSIAGHVKSPVAAAESVIGRRGGNVAVSELFPKAQAVRRVRSGIFQGARAPLENK